MRRLLVVARHEFVKYVTRRGFIISIFMMPAWVLFAAAVPRWIEHNAPPAAFMVVDRGDGFYARAIAGAVAADAAMAGKAAHPRFRDLPPPKELVRAADPRAFAARAAALLARDGGPDAILVVPRGFGADGGVDAQYWTSGPPKPDLNDFLAHTLTDTLRRQALYRAAPAASTAVLEVTARLKSLDPTHKSGTITLIDQAQRYAPSALGFLLVLTIFMNAASLMSAVIEEKSNRIVEVLLSCVSPREFMIGKLLGAAGASLLTLTIWVSAAVAGVWFLIPGGPALVAGVGSGLISGPLLPMLLLCFGCGLLIYASIFLALGSMASSLQDAQALIGPTMILIMAPLLVMPALLRDPNGTIATVMTWIPVYTPFFMMFRLPWNPPPMEIWLATALMVATTALLVWQMGRIFAAHVLTAERPPRLRAILRMMTGLDRAG